MPGLPQAVTEVFLILTRSLNRQDEEVQERLDRQLACPEPLGPATDDLEQGLSLLGDARSFQKALQRVAGRDDIGMSFAPAWISSEVAAGRWHAWHRFAAWIAREHEAALHPICHYFELLGQHRKARQAAGFFQTKAAAWCRKRSLIFGKIGYALASAMWWSKTIEWLQGAEDRDDAQGWLCTNLMLALTESDRLDDACAVAEKVVARELRDHTWACSAFQAALGRALAGDPGTARLHLQEAGDGECGSHWKWTGLLAGELCAVLESPPGSNDAARRQAQAIRTIRAFVRGSYRCKSMAVGRMYTRLLRAMAKHSGRRIRPWDFYCP